MSQLKSNIYSLEDLLRLSRHTIQTLQAKLNDVETQTQAKLAMQDAQLKHLLKSLQDANALMEEAGMQTGVSIGTGSPSTPGGYGANRGKSIYGQAQGEYPPVDKEAIRRMIGQTMQESAALKNRVPIIISAPDPALEKDLERLNGYQYTGKAPPTPIATTNGSSTKKDSESNFYDDGNYFFLVTYVYV